MHTMTERSSSSSTRGYPQAQVKMTAPYTELDIFPTSSNMTSQATSIRLHRRRGLASLPFILTVPNTPVNDVSSFQPTAPGGSATNVLNALRSRTLLDLRCMREFSLLRAKPLPERNLSRLSIISAYNMHTEQLHLQQLTKPFQSIRNNDNTHERFPVKHQNSENVDLRSRIAHAHRKILLTPGAHPLHVNRTSPVSTKVSPKPRQQQQTPRRPRTEPISINDTLSVTKQHGFLQEQDMAALMTATGYSRTELFARWTRFKALCSMATNSYGIDKQTLRHGVPQLSAEDQLFVDRAFDVLDTDGSGTLDWPEFIAALSALEKGDASRRIDFLFHAYDLNGDGLIQRQEVQLFFLASLLVPQTPQTLEVARHFVDKIFISLGREHNDSIRVEDAMKYLREHPATDAYSILGRTMVSTPPSTPVPVGIWPRRKRISTNDLESGKVALDEQKKLQEY